jgi:hypothetical protein
MLSSQFDLPEVGKAPVPEGHERFYHQTDVKNLPSIREHGLQAGHSESREGQSGVHLSREPWNDPAQHEHIATIEVSVPHHEGGPSHRIEGEDIHPSRFLAVHEPWHHAARRIMGDPRHLEATLAGRNDSALDHPTYGPAIKYIKEKHGL